MHAAPEPMRGSCAFAYVIGKEGECVGLHPLNLGSRNGVTASVDYPYAGGKFRETDWTYCHQSTFALLHRQRSPHGDPAQRSRVEPCFAEPPR